MTATDPEIERKLKVAMGVSEMSRALGITRARLYQLIQRGIFPPPAYSIDTRQPMYVEEQQRAILMARKRNCGVDGTPILFRVRSGAPASPRSTRARMPSRPIAVPVARHAHLVEPLRALGLAEVDPARIDRAVGAVFPNGIAGVSEGDVIRRVFLQLRQSLAS